MSVARVHCRRDEVGSGPPLSPPHAICCRRPLCHAASSPLWLTPSVLYFTSVLLRRHSHASAAPRPRAVPDCRPLQLCHRALRLPVLPECAEARHRSLRGRRIGCCGSSPAVPCGPPRARRGSERGLVSVASPCVRLSVGFLSRASARALHRRGVVAATTRPIEGSGDKGGGVVEGASGGLNREGDTPCAAHDSRPRFLTYSFFPCVCVRVCVC